MVPLNGDRVPVTKLITFPKEPWIAKVHHCPQLIQPVFDGCAGQRKPVRCLQGPNSFRVLRTGILHLLGFVYNNAVKVRPP